MTSPQRPSVLPPAFDHAPYEIQYRIIHGYRRAFVKTGAGPALLLIHGIGDSADTWDHVIPVLARRHTVIAPDLLGHGRSDKPRGDYSIAAYANAMRDLLNVLGVDRATVVGHSLGGGVAMQLAYQFPQMCERLALVCAGGVSTDVNPVLRFLATPAAEVVLPLLQLRASRHVTRGVVRLMHRMGSDLGYDADDLVRVIDRLPEPESRAAFVRTLRMVVDGRGQVVTMLDRAYLAKDMPLMLVWGGRDAVIPVKHAHIAHDALPGSRLELMPESGHFPHRSEPERFIRVLQQFIDGTQPAVFDTTRWQSLLRGDPMLDAPEASLRPARLPTGLGQ